MVMLVSNGNRGNSNNTHNGNRNDNDIDKPSGHKNNDHISWGPSPPDLPIFPGGLHPLDPTSSRGSGPCTLSYTSIFSNNRNNSSGSPRSRRSSSSAAAASS